MKDKTAASDFIFNACGGIYTKTTDECVKLVEDGFKKNNLLYKKYSPKELENWYGTAGPYMTFFCAFYLRLKEIRLGHGISLYIYIYIWSYIIIIYNYILPPDFELPSSPSSEDDDLNQFRMSMETLYEKYKKKRKGK